MCRLDWNDCALMTHRPPTRTAVSNLRRSETPTQVLHKNRVLRTATSGHVKTQSRFVQNSHRFWKIPQHAPVEWSNGVVNPCVDVYWCSYLTALKETARNAPAD